MAFPTQPQLGWERLIVVGHHDKTVGDRAGPQCERRGRPLCRPFSFRLSQPPVPLRHPEPMPQVLNIRHLPGFKERQPIIPPDAVYIGRAVRWYRLPKSKWANPFTVRLEADRETAIASYERWLRSQPQLMAALPSCVGWTSPAGARPCPAMAMCCCDWPTKRTDLGQVVMVIGDLSATASSFW